MISDFKVCGLNILAYEKESLCEHESKEFEKLQDIRASLGGVDGLAEWVMS